LQGQDRSLDSLLGGVELQLLFTLGRQIDNRFIIKGSISLPVVIRKVVCGRLENLCEVASGEWRLREQIGSLETWLKDNGGTLDPRIEWVADVGFCVCADARGGGPVITRDMMKMCLDANLQIWLSEYPGDAS
jgi:hypothetical protein